MGKAKKLKREGYQASGFQEIKIEQPSGDSHFQIEILWDNRPIRFGEVDLLVDFLKKAA